MTDSQPHPTTKSGLPGHRSQWTLESPPPAASLSSRPDWVGHRFGWLEIISPEVRYLRKNWQQGYVLTKCRGCGSVQWTYRGNMTRGKTKGCQACSRPKQWPIWLEKRLSAAKDRCTNPRHRQWADYGGRGVTFGFSSVLEACAWVAGNIGMHWALSLDRADNERGYEPGNLKWSSRREQNTNRRGSVTSAADLDWADTGAPYAPITAKRMLRAGATRQAIVATAQQAVLHRRKAWRTIAARLAEFGCTTL